MARPQHSPIEFNRLSRRRGSCCSDLLVMVVRSASELGKPPVILCDGNDAEAAQLKRLLEPLYDLSVSKAPMETVKSLVSAPFRIIVVGLRSGDPSFRELIPLVKKLRPELPIIVIGDGGSLDEQRLVQRQGIFYFVPRPVASSEILSALANAVARGADRGKTGLVR